VNQSTFELKLSLGESLALARKAKGQTQSELADEAGLSRATIAQIEAGDADPKLSTISELAQALDVSSAWLLMTEGDLEIIAEIAESGDLSNILDMLPDELMTWVNSMVRSGRKKNIREALEAIEAVFEEAEDADSDVPVAKRDVVVGDVEDISREKRAMLKAIAKAGAAASSTTAIGARLGSKIGTAVGTAWSKARSKIESD
jgi:transcriptional regulator with XRE-family HTH domain